MPMLSIPVAGGSIPVHVPNPNAPDPLRNVLNPKLGFVAMRDARTLEPAEMATFKAAPCTVSLCLFHKFAALIEFAFKDDEGSGMGPLTLRLVHSAIVQRVAERVNASTILKEGLPIHLIAVDYRSSEVVASREGVLSERMALNWGNHAKRQIKDFQLFDVHSFVIDGQRMLDVLPSPLPRCMTAGSTQLRMPTRAATETVAEAKV